MIRFTQEQQINYLLHQLDLTSVRRRFTSAYPGASTKVIEEEYRKVLVLKFVHGDTHGRLFAAPAMVRNFWEQHVVDTASYLDMLDRLGMRIHFDPDASSLQKAKSQARRLENTLDCYKARFEENPPGSVWGTAKMDDSDSDSADDVDTLVATTNPHDKAPVAVVQDTPRNSNGAIMVVVRTQTGKTMEFKLLKDAPVEHLKGAVEELEGIPVDQQRMIFRGKQLEDTRYLMRDYGLRSKDTVELVLRLRGC